MISHGYVRCTLDHWSVMNSYKYKNCLQRRSFSISPEAMLRFHFQVHENLAKLWYFTNLEFPEIRRSHFPSKKLPFHGVPQRPENITQWLEKNNHPPCDPSDWDLSSVMTARDQVERMLRRFSSLFCAPTKKTTIRANSLENGQWWLDDEGRKMWAFFKLTFWADERLLAITLKPQIGKPTDPTTDSVLSCSSMFLQRGWKWYEVTFPFPKS